MKNPVTKILHIDIQALGYIILGTIFFLSASCNTTQKDSVPAGMAYFEGGDIIIGAEHTLPNEAPAFRTHIDPFFIDIHPVTVAAFREYIEDTGYQTEAEIYGNSAVLDYQSAEWDLIRDANWKHPFGDHTLAQDDHPVTHVSWNDAQAYAEWAGRRLPSEIEWEYAAKGGTNSGQPYSWGNELVHKGEYQANVWQGNFPDKNISTDGFLYTSPVGVYGVTDAGLTDMGGNVWEWTADTYRLYDGNTAPFQEHPQLKVIRGGSFLCHRDVCYSYRVSARQYNSMESAAFHLGFRTAKDIH